MNRIDARFEQLRSRGEAAFIPFLTAGDPTPDATLRVLREAEAAGADVIELGFPFSDPIADGPVIQDSYHRVLTAGVRVADVFDMVREARSTCALPIVAMVSYSIVFRLGFDHFLDQASAAGIDGATIPDLPIEEALPLIEPAQARGFHIICFVAPSTTEERLAAVAQHARGFIYYMSVRGITGERASVADDLTDRLRRLRAVTQTPVAVGFGISQPEHARAVAGLADGVIVGSAIVKRMVSAYAAGDDAASAALDFIRQMSAAAKGR